VVAGDFDDDGESDFDDESLEELDFSEDEALGVSLELELSELDDELALDELLLELLDASRLSLR
jgi:hypothetical protein